MDNPLEKRISDLEEQLASLKRVVDELKTQKSGPLIQNQIKEKKEDQVPFTSAPAPTARRVADKVKKDPGKSSEIWIGRLGIGLLLFGAAFLFKYSIDQGWITPLVRVLFGFGLGIILLITGLRLYDKKRVLSRLLLGGGIATYYITIFSAFQIYNLFSHTVAFILMVAVTCIAFLLALRQDEHSFSLIGALGGFLTPFLLYTGESNTIALVTYCSLLVIGSTLTYMARGWRLLLWLSSWASWIILAVSIDNTPDYGYFADKWVIQVAIILNWLALAVFPTLREYWRVSDPQKWPAPAMEFAYKRISKMAGDTFSGHMHFVAIATPLVALTMTHYTWHLSSENSGYINLITAVIYLAVFVIIRDKKIYNQLNFTQALTGIIVFTWAILLIFDNSTQFIVLGLESWALFLVAQKINDSKLEKVSKILIILSGLILFFRVFANNPEVPYIFNPQAFADLLFLALLTHVVIRMKNDEGNILFYIILHIGLMGWFLRELGDFENGL